MLSIIGNKGTFIIVFLGVLVALSEVALTLVISNIISVVFSSESSFSLFIDPNLVGYLILVYLVLFVLNYTIVNRVMFGHTLEYTNQRVLDLIFYRYNIKLRREEFVNIYVAEMFRVIDKLLINISNMFSKLTAVIFLLIVGLYLAGLQFAIVLSSFLLLFTVLGLSTRNLSQNISTEIGDTNEKRINLLTSLYENRLVFMLTDSKKVIKKLLDNNKQSIVRIRILSNLLSGLPRVFVDVVLFSAVLTMYFVIESGMLEGGSIIFSGVVTLRLVPILNQVYYGFSEVRNNKSSLDLLMENYFSPISYSWHTTKDDSVIFEWNGVEVQYPNQVISLPDFRMTRGEHILLIGPSGSGKSTMLNLILGQIKFAKGNFFKTKGEVSISLCEQNALLFPGTIFFNITLKNSLNEVDLERLRRVCTCVQIFDFIDNVEGLVSSSIDSMGTNFSGGQKQRIALARCLYKEAELYVFDEATSALDARMQINIYENILLFLNGSTSIHISHNEEIFNFFRNQIVLK